MKWKSTMIALLTAGTLLVAFAQVVQESAAGAVDWQQRAIRATGIGMPSAVGGRAGQLRVARADALRKILETVEGMTLSSESSVQEYMLENDRIETSVRGVCRNFREVGEPTYMSDGTIELEVEMILGPEFQHVLIGELAYQNATPIPVQYSDVNPGAMVYTGLIVDCSEIELMPALAPRILSEAGEEVFGHAWVERDWALKHGMAGYVRTMEQAMKEDRIGQQPLLVKALRSSGSRSSDVVIDNHSGKILHALSENLRFLSECRVLFVLDK